MLPSWRCVAMRSSPVDLFVRAVRAGRTPSRRVLQNVAALLESSLAVVQPPTGRPTETERRRLVFEFIELLRVCGCSTRDACQVVCSVAAFGYDTETARLWFTKGKHRTERNAARGAANAKLHAYRTMIGQRTGARALLGMTTRQLNDWQQNGVPSRRTLPDGRIEVTITSGGFIRTRV